MGHQIPTRYVYHKDVRMVDIVYSAVEAFMMKKVNAVKREQGNCQDRRRQAWTELPGNYVGSYNGQK